MLPTIDSSTFVSEGKAIAKAALVAKNKVDARQRVVPFPSLPLQNHSHNRKTKAKPTVSSQTPLHIPLQANALTAPKVLLYSHDTFGLGNIRRTLLLTTALREEFPDAAILIVTGSPVIHAFRIPAGVDYIKLPCLDRVDAEEYQPRFLNHWADEVRKTRQAMLNNAILGFKPDLMIVDKRPAGVDNELLESLELLRHSGHPTKLVLGVRDILDDANRTRQSLIKGQSFELINRFYDEVWIYGDPVIFDHAKEYEFPDSVAQKTHYCGYLQRPTAIAAKSDDRPRVLVTTGGGADGADVVETYLEGLLDLPRRTHLHSVVIFGPEMPEERRKALLASYGHLSDVEFCDFEADMTRRYAEADVVVSMAGYNTVCELLSFGQRAILLPRCKPVMEQLIRAQRFAELGFFEYIDPEQMTPQVLMSAVMNAVGKGTFTMPTIDLGGLGRIRTRVRTLLTEVVNE